MDKKIFGQEISKDLLIDFLNDLLKGERVITDLTFLNNKQLPQYDEGCGIISTTSITILLIQVKKLL